MQDIFNKHYGEIFYALQENIKAENNPEMLKLLAKECKEFSSWCIQLRNELISDNEDKKYTLKQLRQAWAAGKYKI